MTEYDLSDDKTAPAKRPAKNSLLATLQEKLEKDVSRPFVEIEIPSRPGVKLIIDPNIDAKHELAAWRKKAGEGTKGKPFDGEYYASIIVASKTVGIMVDDEEVTSESGAPLTFASPEIKEFLGGIVDPVREGPKKLFGVDPHVESAALAILEQAGFGDEITVSNPTKTS